MQGTLGRLLLITALAALGACAAPDRRAPLDAASPAPDFALSITVRDDAHGLTPARYVLDPDGSLRAAIGPGAGSDLLPNFTRRLGEDERAGVWRLALAAGVPSGAPGSPGSRAAAPGSERAALDRGAGVVIWVRAQGASAVYTPSMTTDANARLLVERFEELAWVR
ncbi:MAG: hypothetical protein EA379_05540 [Phycisphaerales bacterium]|nr:MAG: hypothetical protein EA379_05540 [Phycisphaerales bacterium]